MSVLSRRLGRAPAPASAVPTSTHHRLVEPAGTDALSDEIDRQPVRQVGRVGLHGPCEPVERLVVLLGSPSKDGKKAMLVCSVSKALTDRYRAGDIVSGTVTTFAVAGVRVRLRFRTRTPAPKGPRNVVSGR